MEPLLPDSQDNDALQALGRASVQIVHDLKNQLNGVKLYATFLRKRLEKSERPADELETINKLIGGLDRIAADVSMIVEFSEPLELKRQPETDLERIIREVVISVNGRQPVTGALSGMIALDAEPGPFMGDFDSAVLSGALNAITIAAVKIVSRKVPAGTLGIRLKGNPMATESEGVIEWGVSDSLNHDPFHSFAGSDEIRLSLAARVIEAHGGSAKLQDGALCVRLPLTA
jgi:nitrogen fixation/metabolism regulation signal transduction histidine kinase